MSDVVSLDKYKKLAEENGELKEQLKNEKKYHYVLALRSRIELLQKLLSKNLLDRIQLKMTREEVWIIILEQSKHPYMEDLKRHIKEKGLSYEDFSEAIGILYGDASDRAAHNIPMPKEMKKEDIDKVAELLDVPDDETFVKTVDILRTKLQLTAKAKCTDEKHDKSTSSEDSVVEFDRK